jgi:hypothetical protein
MGILWRLYTGILNRSLFTDSPPFLLGFETIKMALNLSANYYLNKKERREELQEKARLECEL